MGLVLLFKNVALKKRGVLTYQVSALNDNGSENLGKQIYPLCSSRILCYNGDDYSS